MSNLITANTQNASDVLLAYAKESFGAEKKLYQLAEIEYTNEKELAKNLKIPANFILFQKKLGDLVYGNKRFVKYFYDSALVNRIAAETAGSSKIATTFNDLMGKGKAGAIKSQNIHFMTPKELEEGLANFAEAIMEAFSTSDAIDKKYFEANQRALREALFEALKQTPFQFGFGKGGKKNTIEIEKEYREKLGLYADEMPPISSVKTQTKKSRPESKVYLALRYENFAKFLEEHPDEQIEFQLYGDKSVFQSIFEQTSISDMAEKLLKTDIQTSVEKDGLTLRTVNLFMEQARGKVNFNTYQLKDGENWSPPASFQEDVKEISQIFFDVLEKVLNNVAVNDQKAIAEFNLWKKDGIHFLQNFLIANPASIYEIGTKSTRAHVSGMLGETLFSLLLMEAPFSQGDQILNRQVKILGQTSHGTGEAAVDTKVTIDKIGTIGFQIKNFSTSANTAVLYNTSNRLADEKAMSRYITEAAYKRLEEIFFREIYFDEQWSHLINESKNIFNQHLAYYMRYDEASIQTSTEQSNFYIINFNFIPASVIFVYLAEALEEELKQIKYSLNFFYFSPQEVNQEKISAANADGLNIPSIETGINSADFVKSWENTFNTIKNQFSQTGYSARRINSYDKKRKSLNKTENLLSAIKDDARINFTGMKLNFRDNLNVLLDQAKVLK